MMESSNVSLPAAKRRRIDAATSTLTRPFKSPLKQDSNGAKATKAQTPCTHDVDDSGILPASKSSPIVSKERALRLTPQSQSSPIKGSIYSTLLKEQRRLERELREARSDLDTHAQALKIETAGNDEELKLLIEKWKAVSRNAADEMFSKVQDRVNRMGGPAAWREMQKNQSDWKQGGFDEPVQPATDDDCDGLDSSEKRDLYAEYDICPNDDSDAKGDSLDEDSNTFTIDMMLKSINVDLDAIGFDKQQQRWID